jgi:phospholipase/carboxylesterase
MKKLITLLAFTMAAAFNALAQDAKLQEDLSLKYLVQLPSDKSAHPPVIILLHGYGSDERDLFTLRNNFPKNYLIVSARAPYPVSGAGYQWYDMSGGVNKRNKEVDNDRLLIKQFITQVTGKYKADTKSVYLLGFSQGAIMSYEVGLTGPEKLKGIGVLSGKILPPLKPLIKSTPALKQLKIFIAHGTKDDRIPFDDGRSASDYLKGLGLKPEFHQYPGMAHAISNDVLSDLLKWLK